MLPKENRLKRDKDFEAVFKKGKEVKESFLLLKFCGNNLGQTRIGFVVSKKISPKAVVRNAIKRRMRESVRKMAPGMKKGFDVVLVVLSARMPQNYGRINDILQKAFAEAKLI